MKTDTEDPNIATLRTYLGGRGLAEYEPAWSALDALASKLAELRAFAALGALAYADAAASTPDKPDDPNIATLRACLAGANEATAPGANEATAPGANEATAAALPGTVTDDERLISREWEEKHDALAAHLELQEVMGRGEKLSSGSHDRERLLVWWTTQDECQAIEAAAPELPPYLRNELDSRLGRPGRGRLWIPRDIEQIATHQVAVRQGWDTALGRHLAEHCGGIVFSSRDLRYLAALPGTVTDLELRKVGFGD